MSPASDTSQRTPDPVRVGRRLCEALFDLGVRDDPIAACLLGKQQRPVRIIGHLVRGECLSVSAAHADADRQAKGTVTRTHGQRGHGLAQSLRPTDRVFLTCPWQQDAEFLAAVAAHQFGGAAVLLDQRGYLPQGNVSRGVPVLVVDALEKVQVDHRTGQLRTVTPGQRQFTLELVEKGPPIHQAGERVRVCLLLQLGQQLAPVEVGPAPVHRRARPRNDHLFVEWLGDVVVRTGRQAFGHIAVAAESRHEQHLNGLDSLVLPDAPEDIVPVHLGHHDVQQDHVGALLPRQTNGVRAVVGRQQLVSLAGQIVRQQPDVVGGIIHNQHFGHDSLPHNRDS